MVFIALFEGVTNSPGARVLTSFVYFNFVFHRILIN